MNNTSSYALSPVGRQMALEATKEHCFGDTMGAGTLKVSDLGGCRGGQFTGRGGSRRTSREV